MAPFPGAISMSEQTTELAQRGCTVAAMTHEWMDDHLFIDANGVPAERIQVDGHEVIVHYDELPETDVTTINGLRVTTPLRTVIDLAPDLSPTELDHIVRDCLVRGLFDLEEAENRIAAPDMRVRIGAQRLRQALARM